MTQPKLTQAVFGDPKVGKTWYAATAPGPTLVLDSEAGGMRFVPREPQVHWDPGDEPPTDLDKKGLYIAPVHDTQAMNYVMGWLRSGRLEGFRSIVIDSLTEYQSRLVRKTFPIGYDRKAGKGYDDWRDISRNIEDLVVELRDHVAYTTTQVLILVLGAEHREADQKMQVMLQGQMRRKLAYKIDSVARIEVVRDNDGDLRRKLVLVPEQDSVTGHRLGPNVPEVLWDPTVNKLIKLMKGDSK